MRSFPLLLTLLFALWVAPAHARDASPESQQGSDAAVAAHTPAAIFVVRHAEKQAGKDPSLSDAGRQRTAALVNLLGAAGLDAIYSTQWRRTQETALPVAAATSLEVRTVNTEDGFEEKLAAHLMREHAGEAVLVVGHSNTNPALLAALGAAEAPDISDDDYDDVFVMIFPGGVPRLLRLGYGQPTPTP